MELQYTNELARIFWPVRAWSAARVPVVSGGRSLNTMLANRGCTVHDKSFGLSGDKTPISTSYYAIRPNMSFMESLRPYIWYIKPHCPRCGEIGVIVSRGHRLSNRVAFTADGSAFCYGPPAGTNDLIAPGIASNPDYPMR